MGRKWKGVRPWDVRLWQSSGSYRKGGTVDTAVQAILEGAREKGAETRTIYLTEQHLEFCHNCRRCTQAPGLQRGQCVQEDDLQAILDEVEAADAVVLGSPVNYWNVTAIFRRFMERLLGCAYWPWGMAAPQPRTKRCRRGRRCWWLRARCRDSAFLC